MGGGESLILFEGTGFKMWPVLIFEYVWGYKAMTPNLIMKIELF